MNVWETVWRLGVNSVVVITISINYIIQLNNYYLYTCIYAYKVTKLYTHIITFLSFKKGKTEE